MLLTVQYIGNRYLPHPRAYWTFEPANWVWTFNPRIPSWCFWIVPGLGPDAEHDVWYAPTCQ